MSLLLGRGPNFGNSARSVNHVTGLTVLFPLEGPAQKPMHEFDWLAGSEHRHRGRTPSTAAGVGTARREVERWRVHGIALRLVKVFGETKAKFRSAIDLQRSGTACTKLLI